MKCKMCKLEFKLLNGHKCYFCDAYTENPLQEKDHVCVYCNERLKFKIKEPIQISDDEISDLFTIHM